MDDTREGPLIGIVNAGGNIARPGEDVTERDGRVLAAGG